MEISKIFKVNCYECGFEDFSRNLKLWKNCKECDSSFIENKTLKRKKNENSLMIKNRNENLYVNREGLIYSRERNQNQISRFVKEIDVNQMNGTTVTRDDIGNCTICLEAIEKGNVMKQDSSELYQTMD